MANTPEQKPAATKSRVEIITPGHRYFLGNFEDRTKGQVLQFIEKKPSALIFKGPRKLATVNDGCTTEQVIAVLVNRLDNLSAKLPDINTVLAAHHLELALNLLNQRSADRNERGVEGTSEA